MSATYLVDGEAVDLDTARRAFEERHADELAAAIALVELRTRAQRTTTGASPCTPAPSSRP